jgi:phenylacetate-CoA ligase
MRQDEPSLQAAADEIRRFRPHIIIAYTQACAQLARFIVDRGLRDWDDIPVLCGAEAVLSGDRAALERAFGPGIFDTYGSRETMLVASECERHTGLHLSEENLLVEIAGPDGKPLPPGESGDVIVTDLNNWGMPFIRYQNGDVASMAAKPCVCGRGLRMLERVEGRRADTLTDGAGNPIPGILVHVLFADAHSDLVRQFQAVQRRDGRVVLKVVRGAGFTDAKFDVSLKRFTEYLRGSPLTIEFHDSIPPGPNGKRRTIVVERS